LPLSRKKKEELIEELTEQFRNSSVIVYTDYRGLAMPGLNALRKALRAHDAEYHVVKNTLAELALRRAGMPVPEELLAGPTAASIITGDIAGAVRAMTDFAATNRELTIKGGQAGQRILSAEEIPALATLPSREVLLAQVMGGMKAPISGLVTVLGGTIRGLVTVLQAHAKKMEEASAA